MVEAIGNLVTINGKYIVIDHTDKKDDGKGIATIVNVYSSKAFVRKQEINTVVSSFCSGDGGCLTAGKTNFSFSGIFRSNSGNDPMLRKHGSPTKMVIVFNRETKEFFLVMDENVSLADAREFLGKVNEEKSPLLKIAGIPSAYNCLRFPCETMLGELRVSGNPKFEVVTNGRVVFIKLWIH